MRASVFSRNAVLPAPGLETRLVTNTPATSKRSRSAAATIWFFLRMPSRTSTMRGFIDDLQRNHFELASLASGTDEIHRNRKLMHLSPVDRVTRFASL